MKDLSLKEWGKGIARSFIKETQRVGFWGMNRLSNRYLFNQKRPFNLL